MYLCKAYCNLLIASIKFSNVTVQSVAMSSDPKDHANVSQRDSKLKAIFLGWKHAVMNVETTDLHPDFVRMYEEAREFGKMTKALMERVRNAAQPTPAFQKSLLPPSDEYTDCDLLTELMKEQSDSLKIKAPKMSEFYKKEAKAFEEINKLYIIFLNNVKVNTLQPMMKFVDVDLEHIKAEYDKLIRYKKMFDEGRNKLKTCKADKIEDTFTKLNETKSAFERQANLVTDLLRKLPDHMEIQRKAMRQFGLAYRAYYEKSNETLTKMLQETRD